MREIRTEIVLEASPEAVWEVLTDLGAYEAWNPQTVEASGDVAEGERVELTVLSGGRERTMTATVVDADPGRRLEWVSTLGSRWPFSARHTFELEPLGDGRTRLVDGERLTGVLVRVAVPADVESDYEAMNRALAERPAAVDSGGPRTRGPRRRPRRFRGPPGRPGGLVRGGSGTAARSDTERRPRIR